MSEEQQPDINAPDNTEGETLGIIPMKDKALEEIPENQLQQMRAYVSAIQSVEEQVGSNVIQALQHPETTAVISFVNATRGVQHVISIPLDQALFQEVQQLVDRAQSRPRRKVPCIGFHCIRDERLKDAPVDPEGDDESSGE